MCAVIAAAELNGDVLGDRAAFLVVDGDREGFADRLAIGEVINGAVVDGVGPGDDTSAITCGVVCNRWRQFAEHTACACGGAVADADVLHIS